MSKLPALGLGLLVVIQLAALAAMINGKERVLRDGEAFRFKTRPIDPADPFRGRYVWLGFEDAFVPLPPDDAPELRRRQPIYARLATDEAGFARFSGWSRERPASGAYLKTRYQGDHSVWDEAAKTSVRRGLRIDLPFDRYYMDEAKAPRAERAVAEAARATNCWAVVRVLDGRAVIEDVYAQGRRLSDLVADESRRTAAP